MISSNRKGTAHQNSFSMTMTMAVVSPSSFRPHVRRLQLWMMWNILVVAVWNTTTSITFAQETGVVETLTATPPANEYYIGIPQFKQSTVNLTLEYPVADSIPFENLEYRLFDGTVCGHEDGTGSNDISDNDYLLVEQIVPENAPPLGDGSDWRTVSLLFTFDTTTIRSSPIFTENNLTGTISFCVQLISLTAEGINPAALPMYFRETYVTLDITQDGEDPVEGVIVKPPSDNDDVGGGGGGGLYQLVGYLCDRYNVEVIDPDPIFLGMPIRVCVTPDEAARAAGVYMRAIESFSWTRESIFQTAISPTQEVAPLSEIDCKPGMTVCAITTYLKSTFFYKLGNATGAGVGWLQFGQDAGSQGRSAEITMTANTGNSSTRGSDNSNIYDRKNTPSKDDRNLQEGIIGGEDTPGWVGQGSFVVDHPLTRLYTATGYLCDANNTQIAPKDYPITKGMKVRVCVTPSVLAIRQDNVRIRSIDRYKWERTDINLTQDAITTNSQPAPKTEIFCERGSLVCAFQTELDDGFFTESGTITGKGIVWLQFGSDSRRRLTDDTVIGVEFQLTEESGHQRRGGRHLQSGEEYDMGFGLLNDMEPGFAGASPYDAYVAVIPPKESRELHQCRAYECDGNYKEVEPGEPKTEGATIRMCVAPSDFAVLEGANMWSIEWWNWWRKNLTQPAIVEQGQESTDGMTVLNCNRGDPVCVFQTRLRNEFFADAGAMFGEGFCWITFGGAPPVGGAIQSNSTSVDDNNDDDVGSESSEIDPTTDPLYAGSNEISYEFPVTGNYVFVLECPEEDHRFREWWSELTVMQRLAMILSILFSALSMCCLGFCCLFSGYQNSRRDEVRPDNGKVLVNVGVADATTTHNSQTAATATTTTTICDRYGTKDGAWFAQSNKFDGEPMAEDVCFGDCHHPGTIECIKIIREYIRRNPTVSYGAPAFRDITRHLQANHNRTFMITDGRNHPWRIARPQEVISCIGEIWTVQRKHLK